MSNPTGKNSNGVPKMDRNSSFANRGQKGWRHNWRFHSPSLDKGFKIVSHKACRGCSRFLDLSESFYKHRTRIGWYSRCIDCEKRAGKERTQRYQSTEYYKSTERLADASNKSYLRRYGITLSQRNQMIAGGCALCAGNGVGKDQQLEIDHNHVTGVVRGALCCRHNNGIGLFHDDLYELQRAARYVLRGALSAGQFILSASAFPNDGVLVESFEVSS